MSSPLQRGGQRITELAHLPCLSSSLVGNWAFVCWSQWWDAKCVAHWCSRQHALLTASRWVICVLSSLSSAAGNTRRPSKLFNRKTQISEKQNLLLLHTLKRFPSFWDLVISQGGMWWSPPGYCWYSDLLGTSRVVILPNLLVFYRQRQCCDGQGALATWL